MSTRHPSTPPPLENESSNPFFTTPQIKSNSKNILNIDSNHYYYHQRKNSSSSNKSRNHNNTNNKNNNTILFTPQTPYLNNDDEFSSNLLPLSPQTTTKKNNSMIDIFNKQRILDIDPLRTPETTPRHFKRSKELLLSSSSSSIINDDDSKLGHPLFQITPSTVGSGRKNRKSNSSIVSNRKNSDFKNLLDFRSSIKIQLEQDDDGDIKMNNDNEKERELMNYSSSECDSDDNSKQNTDLLRKKLNIYDEFNNNKFNEPKTPPMQIMNDEFIIKKFGVEKLKFQQNKSLEQELDEVREDLRNCKKFPNPFLIDDNNYNESKEKINFNPRYENEIEMIYHGTGEKFFVKLSEEGKKIKPKKLNFDEFRSTNIKNHELLQTPPLSSNRKMSIRGLLNYDNNNEYYGDNDDDYDDKYDVKSIEKEGVRHEKIKNPFVGKFPIKNVNNKSNKNIDEIQKIEFLNQTTGKHIVEDMDEDQVRIKPKKLDFSGC